MESTQLLDRRNTQWMQGVSALMIMLMHFVMQLESYPRALNILGSIGVAVFLFLSGFGINESYKTGGLTAYWRKRFLRVIIPCWVVFLVRLPFVENFDARQLLWNFLFINSDLWFIDFILRWYILFWIARKFLPRLTTPVLLLAALLFIFDEQLKSEQALSFFAGYLCSQHYEKVSRWSKRRVLTFATVAFLYGAAFTCLKELPAVRTYIGTLPFNVILLNIKLPLAFCIVSAPFLCPMVRKIPFICWFGVIGYEIYIVHYNFMPYINGGGSIIFYVVLSTIIAWLFHRFNTQMKSRGQFVSSLATLLFALVCWVLMLKYAIRTTPHFGYVSIGYLIALLLLVKFSQRLIYGKKITGIKNYSSAMIFYSSAIIFCCAMLLVQYHFDPMENQVDRWSAIANPLSALFHGEFPYLAQTHLGGNASPFPVWMILHIPFWLLGNVGLSIIVATGLFLWSIRSWKGSGQALMVLLLLFFCINLWYETAVRSDLLTNFLLLGAFTNVLLKRQISLATHPYALAVIIGLWLSTRLSVAFPLYVWLLPSFLSLSWRKRITVVAIVLGVFALTFLPLVVWDANSLFFFENNPFSLQSRQGRPIDSVVLVLLATAMALLWRGKTERLLLFQSIILLLVPAIAYGHNMYIYDNWQEIFHSAYDITYLDAALPSLVSLIAIKNPSL